MRFHLPPSSFIGDLRRCESCVMPCSRTEAPLAQWPPRLSGESNTGSCRIHTPFCTTASTAQPTEQCVQTERFTSTLPSASSLASACWIIENGSCEATAPAPTVTPERLRNARRSMIFSGMEASPRDRRGWATAWLVALRVRSMVCSSNLGGAVVVVDVRAGLVAARRTLVLAGGRWSGRGVLRHDRGRGRGAAGAHRQQEISAGKPGLLFSHLTPPRRSNPLS